MSKSTNKITHLSDDEMRKYLAWAGELQKAHFAECDAPLDGLCITFEITNLGTSVVAHTGCAPCSGSHIVLREFWK